MIVDINPSLRLLGTAHISTKSVEAVKQQIAEFKPEIVAVELCKSRYDSLVSGRETRQRRFVESNQRGKAPLVLLSHCLPQNNENWSR